MTQRHARAESTGSPVIQLQPDYCGENQPNTVQQISVGAAAVIDGKFLCPKSNRPSL